MPGISCQQRGYGSWRVLPCILLVYGGARLLPRLLISSFLRIPGTVGTGVLV